MLRLLTISVVALLGHFATPAAAGQIAWEDLIDQSAQDFSDPFSELTYDQIDDLRTVVRLRERLNGGEVSVEARPKIEARLAKAEDALASDDIDVDWLLVQRWIVADAREKAATAGNPNVDGKTVVVAGFAIPAPPDQDGAQVAYLVPERGMCSHTPPPNPNQMIRVRITEDWQPRMMHEPVRLTGRISISPSEQTIQVVDGMVPMRATFLLEANKVETLVARQADAAATNDWAAAIAERLRSDGQLPAQMTGSEK